MGTKKTMAINLGSTSTKIAYFVDGVCIYKESVSHDPQRLLEFPTIWDQYDYRKAAIDDFMHRHGIVLSELDAFCSRGGHTEPIVGGTYRINEAMLRQNRSEKYGVHVGNLGLILAYEYARQSGKAVPLTMNLPTTDEFAPIARISGLAEIERRSCFQALNHKAMAEYYAESVGKRYEELNLVVVMLGGGISVAAHCRGKMIDGPDALTGEGPFSNNRCGTVPIGSLVTLCYSGKYTLEQMKRILALALALVMLFALTACGTAAPADSSTNTNGEAEAPAAAEAEAYTIIIGNTGSEQCSDYAGATAFKEYVEKESNGRLQVQLLFNGVLGSDRETLESTQMGSCTMMSTGLTQYTNFVKELTALDGPFMFETAEDVYNLFADEQFVETLNELFATAKYKYMGMSFQGFRTLTSNREVHSMADMKGMTIRVIESATPMALWTALGANPTPLAFTEVYTALQQGTVDAQENPLELIYSQRFYEQQKYIVNTNHQIQPLFLSMNLDFYNNLPDDLKAIVDAGCEEYVKAARAYSEQMLETYKQTMADAGCTFIDVEPDDFADMYEATASVRASLTEQYPEFSAVLNDAITRTQG